MSTVRLLSSDNHVFEIAMNAIDDALTIKNMIDDTGSKASQTVLVRVVIGFDSTSLRFVIRECMCSDSRVHVQ